jgi:adenosylmethionine-8-amino-7-oxononanoate aminotransferase
MLRDIEPLVIFDEIATGFGRTGTLFAFEQTGAHPDLLCLGKGLTGGALALSCTLARRRIYEAFIGDPRDGVHFLHGHSYAGNPIACAAALASLGLFDEEGTLERAERIASRVAMHLQRVRAHPLVRETRQAGTMIGIELAAEAIDRQHAPTPGWRIAGELYDAGHFTRPIGNVLQLVPPLCSTDCEIDAFFDALDGTLKVSA